METTPQSRTAPASAAAPPRDEPDKPALLAGSIPVWRSVVLLVLAAAVFAVCREGNTISVSKSTGVIMDLPIFLGDYYGREGEVSKSEKTMLPLDTLFERRVYESLDRTAQINCQIVLSGGEKRSIHRPEICLPGQGWSIESSEIIDVPLAAGGTLGTTKLILTRPVQVAEGDTRQLRTIFLYWFVGADKTTPHHWRRVLLTSWDRVFHNQNHRWAYVVVSSPIMEGFAQGGKDYAQTLQMLEDFAGEIAPRIMKPTVHPGG